MLINHFKIAFRTLVKNPLYSFINIAGLAISLSATLLILLWVWDELSYDTVHSKARQIFAVTALPDKTSDELWFGTPAATAHYAESSIPEVEGGVRVISGTPKLVEYEGKRFLEDIHHVDPFFFQMFDFQFLVGNNSNPFDNLHSVVITKSIAKKYFGDANPIGKTIRVDKADVYQVSGVIEDIASNSTINCEIILPMALLSHNNVRNLRSDWWDFSFRTFFLLREGAKANKVAKQITQIHVDNNPQNAELLKSFEYSLVPLLDLHFKSNSQRVQQVKIFSIIAIVILIIACINYVNLVMARTSRRNKEVGVRKVVGATRMHLFCQFMSESFVMFFIALVIAVGLTFIAMPVYNVVAGKEMVYSLLDGRIWLLFLATLIAILLIAGIYPALVLSTFNPATSLKGVLSSVGFSGNLRKALVVVQFTCSVILIVSTIVVGNQLSHIRKMDLGYDKKNILTFRRQNFENLDGLKSELRNNAGVGLVSASSERLDNVKNVTTSIEWEGKPSHMSNYMIGQLSVDKDFIQTMDIELASGTGFTGTPADSTNYILNETAAKQMDVEIGSRIVYNERPGGVAGIVKDFHFQDMKTSIGPLIMAIDTNRRLEYIYVRTNAANARSVVGSVEKLWRHYNADYEFDYTFMDETFDQLYREDIRSGHLFNIFAGIAILLSCLGLFGLVTYTAELKVKEIGVRKTLGASVSNIILLISKDFLKLVLISIAIAFPLSWWIMNDWLDNFAYRTSIDWWIFVLAGCLSFAIAAFTVCGKSLKAAKTNPIKAIRSE